MDLCLESDGRTVLSWPVLNHDFDCIAEMVTTPTVLMGLADAGAHTGRIPRSRGPQRTRCPMNGEVGPRAAEGGRRCR